MSYPASRVHVFSQSPQPEAVEHPTTTACPMLECDHPPLVRAISTSAAKKRALLSVFKNGRRAIRRTPAGGWRARHETNGMYQTVLGFRSSSRSIKTKTSATEHILYTIHAEQHGTIPLFGGRCNRNLVSQNCIAWRRLRRASGWVKHFHFCQSG